MDGERIYDRRQVLGRAPLAAAVGVGALAGPVAGSDARSRQSGRLIHYGREAMACLFEITLPESQERHGAEAAVEALNLIDRLEDQMTVYRESSDISSINRRAAFEPVAVEGRLFELLQLSRRLWVGTNGAFDISAGALSRLWGFHQRQGQWVDDTAVRAALRQVGMQHVRLGAGTVTFDVDGLKLNLGSIGKGYALDRAVKVFTDRGVESVLLTGGSSSMRAMGDLGAGGGWKVGIRDPQYPRRHAARLTLRNRAMSTSGIGEQFFEHRGRRYGHLIDPRTGYPAEGMLSATAVAPTAAEADALATSFFILGVAGSVEYCRRHPGVGAILLADGGRGDRVEAIDVGIDSRDLEVLI